VYFPPSDSSGTGNSIQPQACARCHAGKCKPYGERGTNAFEAQHRDGVSSRCAETKIKTRNLVWLAFCLAGYFCLARVHLYMCTGGVQRPHSMCNGCGKVMTGAPTGTSKEPNSTRKKIYFPKECST
jgi:hypothetical protein